MSLLVVGSIAFDTVYTPFGMVEEALGGSATYFSISASYFTDNIKVVAVVGSDFPEKYIKMFEERNIDTSGILIKEGQTFRWKGEYGYDLKEVKTLDTQLNVFEDFDPKLSEDHKNSKYIFLANIDPTLQGKVLQKMKDPKFIALDTMNYWIKRKYEALLDTIQDVNTLIINEGEARELSGEYNLIKAAKRIFSFGPERLIIKRGESGVLMFAGNSLFCIPAYPLENVYDPTGAGDSFAGGFMGYLSKTEDFSEENIRRAVVFGCVMASFAIEDFSVNRLLKLKKLDIENRFREFKALTYFENF